jgi:hypothetical protein
VSKIGVKVQILKGPIICRDAVELKATFEAKAEIARMAIPVKPPTVSLNSRRH